MRGGGARSGLLLFAASLLATAPVWIPDFPAMADLPQHAVQVALLSALGDPAFRFTSLFEINWFTPYLADLIAYPLVPIIGIVAAMKVVTSIALAAMPVTSAKLMDETGTDRRWAWLTIPGIYGVSYQWGFLNFLIAVPAGLYLITLAFRQAREPRVNRDLAIALLTVALFFSHALVAAFFGGIAGLILVAGAGSLRRAIRAVAPFLVAVPLVAIWLPGFRSTPLGSQPMLWQLGFNRLSSAFTWMLGFPHGISLVTGLLIAALPLAAGAAFRSGRTLLPLLVCIATVVFAPAELMAATGLYQRFAWFLLPFYFMAFEPPRKRGWPSWMWYTGSAIVLCTIIGASAQAYVFRQQSAPFGRMLAAMAPGERAVWMPFTPGSHFELAPPFMHFGAWYSAVTRGVVDPSMAAAHTPIVRYRAEHRPEIRNHEFEKDPSTFDWRQMRGYEYRYFMAVAVDDPGPLIAGTASCPIRQAFHEARWWLYERDPACR